MSRTWFAGAVSPLAFLAMGGVATADPNNNNSEKLRAAVVRRGSSSTRRALEGISDRRAATASAGAPGP